MKEPSHPRSLAIVMCLLAVSGKASAQDFQWTISASSTDPFVNTTTFSPGLATYYLWLSCNGSSVGAAAAEFELYSTDSSNVILGLNMMNGWLNAGSPTRPLLAVGGCPTQSLAASLQVDQSAPGQWCFRPDSQGYLVTVACGGTWTDPVAWTGLGTDGSSPCTSGACPYIIGHCPTYFCNPDGSCDIDGVLCPVHIGCQVCTEGIGVQSCADCTPTAVDSPSWGRVKSLYR